MSRRSRRDRHRHANHANEAALMRRATTEARAWVVPQPMGEVERMVEALNTIREARARGEEIPSHPTSLPGKLEMGDGVWVDGLLLGHLDERGEQLRVVAPDGAEHWVPMVFDGSDAESIFARCKADPTREVDVRFGPPAAPGEHRVGTPHPKEPLSPAYNLPPGMEWNDPVYAGQTLVGHIREGGKPSGLVIDGETYVVPILMDMPEAEALIEEAHRRGADDDTKLNIQIGGTPKPGRTEYVLDVDEIPEALTAKGNPQRRFTYSGALDGKPDTADNVISLITSDPDVIAAFDYGYRNSEMLTETIEKLIAAGLQHRQIDIETNDERMAGGQMSARMTLTQLAEKFPHPKKQKGQDAIRHAIEGVLGEKYGPERDIARNLIPFEGRAPTPTRGGRLINSETDLPIVDNLPGHPLMEAINSIAKEQVSIEQWAHDVDAESRRQGYTGPPFTPEIAEFYRSTYEAGKGDEQAVRGLFRSMDNEHFGKGFCDFCNARDPMWEYPCEDFIIPTPTGEPYRSEGAWAACEQCASLIERNERIALVNRYLNTKPAQFRDLIRPWSIRLHNQFFRRREGDRVRAPNYIGRTVEREDAQGQITITTPDNPDVPPEIAEQVRNSGDVALAVEGKDGQMHVIASGQENVDITLERRRLTNSYVGHPLVERYMQHVKTMQATRGLWRNMEAWQALAEKYVTTYSAGLTLGLPERPDIAMHMYFDPQMVLGWPAEDRETHLPTMGLYITRALHDSVPYLWTEKCDQLAAEPDLPVHHVTRGLVPHPCMFWSFETALGMPEARIDWMLIIETARGYEVWCPLADDIKRDGKIMLTGTLVPYGAKWPDDLKNNRGDLAEWLLKRLAFLNSKYVDTPRITPHRAIRREVERRLKPNNPPPDDLGAYVVHLRAPEPKPAAPLIEGEGKDIKRQHCWWRRAHTRVIWKRTPRERAVWVRAALCGDTSLPLIRKTYVVDH